LETVDQIAVGEIRTKIRDILGAFLFSGEDVEKKVKVLSGGERTRLAMIRLMLEPVNFLVLDEPTNHLDIRSKERLKQALALYDGTVLVVSHDREFLDGLVSCVYEFRHNKIRQHLGGIYDFLRRKKMESLGELERVSAQPQQMMKSSQAPERTDSAGQMSYEERKEINKNLSRLEKQIFGLEDEITRMEDKLARMNKTMAVPGWVPEDGDFERYEELKKDMKKVMSDWEKQQEQYEQLQQLKTW
ncbi:MAG: ATP-binding cassette domain-containing protein, partial [Mangrovibacterium sp.]